MNFTNSCKKFCTVHILEQHKNAVAKEKVNIVAVDSTHGKNSYASRSVGRSGGGRGRVSNNLRPFLYVCLFFGHCQRRMSEHPKRVSCPWYS
jgi:hypothetical protein